MNQFRALVSCQGARMRGPRPGVGVYPSTQQGHWAEGQFLLWGRIALGQDAVWTPPWFVQTPRDQGGRISFPRWASRECFTRLGRAGHIIGSAGRRITAWVKLEDPRFVLSRGMRRWHHQRSGRRFAHPGYESPLPG
jgi:hypothetical protein